MATKKTTASAKPAAKKQKGALATKYPPEGKEFKRSSPTNPQPIRKAETAPSKVVDGSNVKTTASGQKYIQRRVI